MPKTSIAHNLALQFQSQKDTLVESQQVAAMYQTISDLCPIPVFISSSTGECIYTNAAYQSMVGCPLSSLIGDKWKNFIHPEDRQNVVSRWSGLVSDNSTYDVVNRMIDAFGQTIPVHVKAVRLPSGQYVGFCHCL